MELDMTGAPVMVFRHASHGRVNLVYRRADGNVGWIDPPAMPCRHERPLTGRMAVPINRRLHQQPRSHPPPDRFQCRSPISSRRTRSSRRLKVNGKKQALQEIAAKAAELTGQSERAILEILLQREKLGSTGVGNGIAIPHGKLPKLDKPVRPVRAAGAADRFRGARRPAGRSGFPAARAGRRRRRSSQGAGARRAAAARSRGRAQAPQFARRGRALCRAGDAVRERGLSINPSRRSSAISRC